MVFVLIAGLISCGGGTSLEDLVPNADVSEDLVKTWEVILTTQESNCGLNLDGVETTDTFLVSVAKDKCTVTSSNPFLDGEINQGINLRCQTGATTIGIELTIDIENSGCQLTSNTLATADLISSNELEGTFDGSYKYSGDCEPFLGDLPSQCEFSGSVDGQTAATISISPSSSDTEGDGIPNTEDNCPRDSNPDQADSDSDGVGDLCEKDADYDGVINDEDNCLSTPNEDQSDIDGDEIGDRCEPDGDWDSTIDDNDNCPDDYNPDQVDSNGDGMGDACEENDNDGDGVINDNDNCDSYNPDQEDLDEDGLGDVCEPDSDSDLIIDDLDNCPDDYNHTQTDSDGDGIGDACDPLNVTIEPISPEILADMIADFLDN